MVGNKKSFKISKNKVFYRSEDSEIHIHLRLKTHILQGKNREKAMNERKKGSQGICLTHEFREREREEEERKS